MKKLIGAAKQRKDIESKVSVELAVHPHNDYTKVRTMFVGYCVTPITEVVGTTVNIRYTVIQCLPMTRTCEICERLTDEWGAVAVPEWQVRDWMAESTTRAVTAHFKEAFVSHVGPWFAREQDAVEWSRMCAKQLVMNGEIAKRKFVTHCLKIMRMIEK